MTPTTEDPIASADAFAQAVALYLERTGMAASTLGRRCLGDPNFVGQMQSGDRVPREKTRRRVLSWMAQNPTAVSEDQAA